MALQFTKRELDIIFVVWDLGSATVGEVKERLFDDLAYSTFLTVFQTFTTKGGVRF